VNPAQLARAALKPEYLFNPRQALRRLQQVLRPRPGKHEVVTLPWGAPLEVNVADSIGRAVWNLGVYELVVTEALWRLADPGETCADVGANIGHMTSVLAARVGQAGRVVAFEPHPGLRRLLEANVARWPNASAVNVRPEAVAEHRGRGALVLPTDENMGTAHLGQEGVAVDVTTLVDVFGESAPSVMKLDVEGAELSALRGAGSLLRGIRDIVYEDHAPQPSAVAELLRAQGFELWRLRRSLWGPTHDTQLNFASTVWEPPVFLATHDVARATARLGPRGWRCLSRRA
jgi:FkbM family methyltransferase